jgi:sugar (pentulose or hexulose) kinase
VGGSSNSGGAILRSLFQAHELIAMTDELDHKQLMGQLTLQDLHYYPLLSQGERFPINDPHKMPIISPKPSKQCDFFQALLEGMADIEALAYKKLVDLGAPYPKLIRSIGGGAKNKTWHFIREQKIGIPIIIAEQQQAAAGSAILAQKFWK